MHVWERGELVGIPTRASPPTAVQRILQQCRKMQMPISGNTVVLTECTANCYGLNCSRSCTYAIKVGVNCYTSSGAPPP